MTLSQFPSPPGSDTLLLVRASVAGGGRSRAFVEESSTREVLLVGRISAAASCTTAAALLVVRAFILRYTFSSSSGLLSAFESSFPNSLPLTGAGSARPVVGTGWR